MSMTMYAKDDPHFHDNICMKCKKKTPHRVESTFANELRAFLCLGCHYNDFIDVVYSWLGKNYVADGHCSKCRVKVMCNRSCVGNSTPLELCPDCQESLTAHVKNWLRMTD